MTTAPAVSRLTRLVAIAATGIGLVFTSAMPARSQSVQPTLPATTSPTPFIAPIPWRFLMAPDDPRIPRVCRQSTSTIKCPSFLAYGGAAGGGLPTIDPAFKADLPHARVTFLVHRVENEIVANEGVDLGIFDWPWTWTGTGSAASVEFTDGAYILPTPGQVWVDNTSYLFRLYDALVFNACASFSGFPIEHTSSIHRSDGSVINDFHGVDNTTLDELGFYNFQFSVRVEGDRGRVSNFRFSGTVSVTCSGLNELP
jgi:hypothetical protein